MAKFQQLQSAPFYNDFVTHSEMSVALHSIAPGSWVKSGFYTQAQPGGHVVLAGEAVVGGVHVKATSTSSVLSLPSNKDTLILLRLRYDIEAEPEIAVVPISAEIVENGKVFLDQSINRSPGVAYDLVLARVDASGSVTDYAVRRQGDGEVFVIPKGVLMGTIDLPAGTIFSYGEGGEQLVWNGRYISPSSQTAQPVPYIRKNILLDASDIDLKNIITRNLGNSLLVEGSGTSKSDSITLYFNSETIRLSENIKDYPTGYVIDGSSTVPVIATYGGPERLILSRIDGKAGLNDKTLFINTVLPLKEGD